MGPTTYKSQGAQLLETKDSATRSLHSAHSSLYTLPLPGMVNVHTHSLLSSAILPSLCSVPPPPMPLPFASERAIPTLYFLT